MCGKRRAPLDNYVMPIAGYRSQGIGARQVATATLVCVVVGNVMRVADNSYLYRTLYMSCREGGHPGCSAFEHPRHGRLRPYTIQNGFHSIFWLGRSA